MLQISIVIKVIHLLWYKQNSFSQVLVIVQCIVWWIYRKIYFAWICEFLRWGCTWQTWNSRALLRHSSCFDLRSLVGGWWSWNCSGPASLMNRQPFAIEVNCAPPLRTCSTCGSVAGQLSIWSPKGQGFYFFFFNFCCLMWLNTVWSSDRAIMLSKSKCLNY